MPLKHILTSCSVSAAFLLSCLPALADDKPLFEDNFASSLATGWTWIDELPGTWQVAENVLELKVVPVGEGLWAGGQRHPNLLLREPPKGDFAVEVELNSNPTGEFEHAGLLLHADGDNYVVINKEMTSKLEVVMVSEKASKPAAATRPYEHEAICLRLAVRGNKVTGQFRHYDSDEWQTLGEQDLPVAGPYKVGLFAGRPPQDADHRVRFSHFRILPVAATVASAPPTNPTSAPAAVQPKRPIRTDIPLAEQARQAAEQAIPYIEKDGTAWINDRKCLACHYVGYMVWSFRDASQHGMRIDKTKLAEWTDWSLSHAVGQGIEGPAQMLLARDRADRREQTVKLLDTLRDAIIKEQQSDGSWKPGGQLPSQKRPLGETAQVSTMLCLLALDSLEAPNDKAVEARDKALAWIKQTSPNGDKPAESSEWYAMRLLVANRFSEPQQVAELRDKILAAQQSDGGWGWLLADKSDAFGTGVSLYALSQTGLAPSHPTVERAWRFLIETQTDNGSWIVNGTKTATKDKPHPFSGFWGTTWALLGLSHTLPEGATTAAVSTSSATAGVAR